MNVDSQALEQRVKFLEAALSEIFDVAVPEAMPWMNSESEKATYAARVVPGQIRGRYRLLDEKAEERKADENEHLDIVVNEWKARVRGLVQDNDVYKGFWKQEQAEHKRVGELAAELNAKLELARKALVQIIELPHASAMRVEARDALASMAQIGASQKAGKE